MNRYRGDPPWRTNTRIRTGPNEIVPKEAFSPNPNGTVILRHPAFPNQNKGKYAFPRLSYQSSCKATYTICRASKLVKRKKIDGSLSIKNTSIINVRNSPCWVDQMSTLAVTESAGFSKQNIPSIWTHNSKTEKLLICLQSTFAFLIRSKRKSDRPAFFQRSMATWTLETKNVLACA